MKITIHFDGSATGTPGPGCGAAVLEDEEGRETVVTVPLASTTANQAEYVGIIAGLSKAISLGATEVAVFGDSKLVVEQVNGRWKAKHPNMVPLHREAKRLLQDFVKWTVQWVPRENNIHADAASTGKPLDNGLPPELEAHLRECANAR